MPGRQKWKYWIGAQVVWPTVFAFLRFAARVKLSRGQKRHILLLGDSPMKVKYLCIVRSLLAQDSRLDFSFTSGLLRLNPELGRQLGRQLGVPYIMNKWARMRHWDLIIFACHNGSGQFARHIPKLQIYHSLTGGKIVKGENYRFGPARTIRDGLPVYKMMFVPSEKMRRRALMYNPQLGDSIAVVGDHFVDRLLSMNKNRETLRQEFGFAPGDQVVLIQSTFGPHSLMESLGLRLTDVLDSLQDRYKFILSTHPTHWLGAKYEYIRDFLAGQRKKGALVIEPGADWERYAIASDICLSDHTGLVCNYALLGKPLIMIRQPSGILSDGAEELDIYNEVPRLESPEELPALLEQSGQNYPFEKLKKAADGIVSHRGRSDSLMRDHLYQLLGLKAPPAV